MKGYKYT